MVMLYVIVHVLASILSKYFESVFSGEDTTDLPLIDTSIHRDISVLSHIELSSCTIYKKLMKLKQ